jgi:hypothetical protein
MRSMRLRLTGTGSINDLKRAVGSRSDGRKEVEGGAHCELGFRRVHRRCGQGEVDGELPMNRDGEEDVDNVRKVTTSSHA